MLPGRKKRGPRCRVCIHKERARIEVELAAGSSHYEVAREFGLSRHSLDRHFNGHMTAARKAELIGGPVAIAKLAKRACEEDRSLLDYLSILRSELMRLFVSAKEAGKLFEAAQIAGRLLNVLETIGKLSGQLRQAGIVVNNLNSIGAGPAAASITDTEIAKMQVAIIRALSPFPEARAAVVAALRDLESPQPMRAGKNGAYGPPLALSAPVQIEAWPMGDLARAVIEFKEAREAFAFWHERCVDMQREFGSWVWRQRHELDMELLRERRFWKLALIERERALLARGEGRA